jgi:peptide/nickel transport system substrate-binding protein
MDWKRGVAALCGLAAVALLAPPSLAQKPGGVLRTYNSSNPPSASIYEEATIATAMPFSAVFNNLLMFDPAKPRNGLDTIVPELAESWAWDPSRTRFTVKLRRGVKWHDGKPFTAKDVQCTWHRLIGKDPGRFPQEPARDLVAQPHRGRGERRLRGDVRAEQPAGFASVLLATNLSPVYPCHVPLKDMRTKPIGTGPFKFVAFDSNKSITLEKNKEYWKPGRPYLDGIQYSIIGSRSTRTLAFAANEFDLTFVADITPPMVATFSRARPRRPASSCRATSARTCS